jgi:diaminopimelate decarboxylase
VKNRLKIPKALIEPGRSIVANAGTTLYKVGATKETYGGKTFIFVDGGMTDNPRTALYDAIYEGAIANKITKECTKEYTIAGKCCESGDIIIKNIILPPADKNDIVAIFSTGAYNYSMASNYNRLRKPAVIFVENGKSKVVVKRETYEDIIRNDVI